MQDQAHRRRLLGRKLEKDSSPSGETHRQSMGMPLHSPSFGQFKPQVDTYLGQTPDGRPTYVKEISFSDRMPAEEYEKKLAHMEEQRQIGSQLDHPNHTKLLHYEIEGRTHRFYYSVASGKRLDAIVAERNLTKDEVLNILEQVAMALAYSHNTFTPPILHGDLSPGNIIYDEENNHVAVIDHDASIAQLVTEDFYTTRLFTPGFAAPEIFEGDVQPASDMYGSGMLAVYMLTGKHPKELCSWTGKQDRKELETALRAATTDLGLVELVLKMTAYHPSLRPTAEEVIKDIHGIRNGSVDDLLEENTYQPAQSEGLSYSGVHPSWTITAGIGLTTAAVIMLLYIGASLYRLKVNYFTPEKAQEAVEISNVENSGETLRVPITGTFVQGSEDSLHIKTQDSIYVDKNSDGKIDSFSPIQNEKELYEKPIDPKSAQTLYNEYKEFLSQPFLQPKNGYPQ